MSCQAHIAAFLFLWVSIALAATRVVSYPVVAKSGKADMSGSETARTMLTPGLVCDMQCFRPDRIATSLHSPSPIPAWSMLHSSVRFTFRFPEAQSTPASTRTASLSTSTNLPRSFLLVTSGQEAVPRGCPSWSSSTVEVSMTEPVDCMAENLWQTRAPFFKPQSSW